MDNGDGDVRSRGGIGPGFSEEYDVRGGAVEEVPDFGGVFVEGSDVEEDALQGLWCSHVVAGGLCWIRGLDGAAGIAAAVTAEGSVGVG